MCTVLLPLGVNPIALNKHVYMYIYIITHHFLTVLVPCALKSLPNSLDFFTKINPTR